MSALVGLGDADAFYASAEVVRRPWLRGLPVGVLGNQGACVIARSYEMKRAGVKVGEPVWDAVVKGPDGIYLKRDFRWYEELGRKIHRELGTFSPTVEYYSIDECFWRTVPEAGRTWQQTAEAVRAHVRARVGVPMTVAYARSRTLAKLFADTSKPNGAIAVTDPEHEVALLARLPVTEIAGIGAPRGEARKVRHPHLPRLPAGIRPPDPRPPHHPRARPVAGVQRRPGRPDPPRAHPAQEHLPRRVARRPRPRRPQPVRVARPQRGAADRGAALPRRPAACPHRVRQLPRRPGAGGSVNLNVPSDRFDELLEAAKVGLRKAWRRGESATHMHLIASRLVKPPGWQQSLFDPPDPRADAVARVKREVNERFGRFTLRSGATLFANDFYLDPANDFDVCDVRGKFCF